MLDAGWPVATVAETLGLDEATVYRYSGLWHVRRGPVPGPRAAGLLGPAHQRPAGAPVPAGQRDALHGLSGRARRAAARTYQVPYSRSGLMDRLHRLGFTSKLTTPVTCQADAVAQATESFITKSPSCFRLKKMRKPP